MNRTARKAGLRTYEYASRGGQTQPAGYTLSAGPNGGIQCIIPAGAAVTDPGDGALVYWPLLDEDGSAMTIASSGNLRDDFEYRVVAKELVTTTGSGVTWIAGISTDTTLSAAGILHGISYAAANRAARAVRLSGGSPLTTDDASPSAAVNVFAYGNTTFNSPGFPSYYLTTLMASDGDPGLLSGDNAGTFQNTSLTGALYVVIAFYRAGNVASDTTVEVRPKVWATRARNADLFR